MRLSVAALATFAALAGCDAPSVERRWSVEDAGYAIRVEKIAGRNSWFASHQPGQMVGGSDPAGHVRNIRAIERVAGCAVDPTSILHNPLGYSTAAVTCG